LAFLAVHSSSPASLFLSFLSFLDGFSSSVVGSALPSFAAFFASLAAFLAAFSSLLSFAGVSSSSALAFLAAFSSSAASSAN